GYLRSAMYRPSLSRRHVLSLGALASLSAACTKKIGHAPDKVPPTTKEVPPNVPFGARPHEPVGKVIFPSPSPAERDRAVIDFYGRWKKKYLKPGCNPGELVVETKNNPSQL